ncbi:MAG: YiiX/YebB-like N1pC/P60 family cysteine hydrolase [Alphaproteobacteria bacterium]|jgi:hypothetical protein
MLKTLLSNFYPISCSRYHNQDLFPGDLLFYRANSVARYVSDFISGVSAVSPESIYHVAIVVESNLDYIAVVQSLPENGVSISYYNNICVVENILSTIEVRRVDVDKYTANKAIEIVRQYIGEAYNDKFSPDFNNSKGEHSFYCSQLIQHAYNEASDSEVFPSHPMGFPGQDGKVSTYWLEYFEKLNVEVPVGVNGSHPGIMYESNFLIDII